MIALCVILFFTAPSHSCDQDQPSSLPIRHHPYLIGHRYPFFYNPYYYYPDFNTQTRMPPSRYLSEDDGEDNQSLGRTPFRDRHQADGEVENRLLLPNRFGFSNPLIGISSFLSSPRVQGLATGLTVLDGSPCTSPSGEVGVCTNSRICSSYGGRSSGTCGFLGTNVCCINTVTGCGGLVTLNNTYWTSPTSVSSDSTCSLTIRLDPTLLEQKKNPLCQVRLDFETFSIAQPNTQTVCAVDSFRTGGASNKIPVICGDNGGQHMYLNAESSTSDFQLIFQFGAASIADRSWRIRISMISCTAPFLAPPDCLQYFTQSSGFIRSFNWKEASASATAPRQLANQDYNICFRTERISTTSLTSRLATSLCLAPCTITTTGTPTPLAFSLTGDSTSTFLPAGTGAGTGTGNCLNTDFINFDGAVDASSANNFNDRFCGNQFSAVPLGTTPATLCSVAKPFNVRYRTDGTEGTAELGNNGFCLRFEERAT